MPKENYVALLLFVPVCLQRKEIQQLYQKKAQSTLVRFDTQLRSRQENGATALVAENQFDLLNRSSVLQEVSCELFLILFVCFVLSNSHRVLVYALQK